MQLAAEHFRALKEEINLNELKTIEDIQTALRKIIQDTQQLTLTQMDDSLSRQLGSIMFSHEAGLISALSSIEPPTVKWNQPKKLSASSLVMLTGFALSVCAASLMWSNGKYFWAILSVLGFAAAAVAYFWPEQKPTADVEQSVNKEALFLLAERRMEAIDRDLEAFLSIPTDSADEDEGVLQLITKAVTLKREDPDSVPDELMTVITAISIARGYALLEYSEENEGYFDVMPTIRATRTIVPALMKNDKLLARGMAILHTEEIAEDE